YWLLDIDNGIMNEPMVDIERTTDEWETTGNWPHERAEPGTIWLRPENEEVPGSLMTSPILGEFTQSFNDNPEQTEQQMVEDEFTAKENRLMYLSPELKVEVQLSGVPKLNKNAS
ncbi:CocE/NonD family hydrolase C-terminal non-catalytic domain-containing protein, partial [Virgibacillus salexigens]|uniref:CocE/NonD family hydrolase C-terminal non-catalytic domain-containing protein n=1 Tax=Virgibacillus salexigens TaxID=61016 RepID=UPI003081D2A6